MLAPQSPEIEAATTQMGSAEATTRGSLLVLSTAALQTISMATAMIPQVLPTPASLMAAQSTAAGAASMLKTIIMVARQVADGAQGNPVAAEAVSSLARMSRPTVQLAKLPPNPASFMLALENAKQAAAITPLLTAPEPAPHALEASAGVLAAAQAVQTSSQTPAAYGYATAAATAAIAVCIAEAALTLRLSPQDSLAQMSQKRVYDKNGQSLVYDGDGVTGVAARAAPASATVSNPSGGPSGKGVTGLQGA